MLENKSSNRRSFIATTALTSLGLSSYGRDWTGKNPTRYPDPSIISIDPRFDKYKLGNTPVQRLYTNPNRLWNEGCAWNAVGRYLVFSDVPGDLQLRWIEDDNRVTVFRKPSGNSNGNTFDYHGRQISCQHGPRRVVRYEHDGSETVLASHFNGKKFNSPNDVVVNRNDDSIWFTDPSYGIMKNYTGTKAKSELKEAVYRIDSKTGKISKVTDDIIKPNGLCFSPNLKKLYVADTGVGGNDIKVWDIDGEKVMFDCGPAATHKLVKSGLWPTARSNHRRSYSKSLDTKAETPNCRRLCSQMSSWGRVIEWNCKHGN